MQEKIVILPCNGDSATGKITWIAAQELVLEGKAEWYSPSCENDRGSDTNRTNARSFIIVDGCDRKCLYNIYLKRGLVSKYQLALDDIGIDALYLADIKREDIELAKDAIVAMCTKVKNMHPILLSGCCCR